MSLSKQATDKPTNPNATHAAIKWNDFAAKEFEEHYKSRTRHRNHIPQQRYQQQSQQQQRPSVLYLPPLPPSPKPLSPTNSSPSIPSTTPPIQKQQLPSQQQKPTNDSVQSWQNFALEASKTTPNNNNNNMNNDNGITTTTTRQRQNNNNTYFATPRKSLSENVQRNRYHYDINNNTTTNTQYNNNINTIKTKIKMITSSIPSPRTNKSTSSIPARRFQSTLNDPPLCFCNELANERKTSHEGTIYECHWLQNNIDDKQQVSSPTTTTTPVTKERLLCAFHVHKEFWNTCRQNLREKKSIDKLDGSLASCPEFNLTFSIVLPQQRNNTFTKRIPYTPPNCFCNRPARLFDDPNRYHKERPFFACKQLDGSDPPIRCGFFLSIENARFKPTEREGLELPIPVSSPTTSFSSTSDHSTCSRQQKHRRNQYQHYNNNNNPDWPPSPHGSVCSIATTTSFRINPDEDETIYNSQQQQQQQSSDPLDTLLKTSANRKSMNHLPFIKTNEENESILSNNNNHYNNEEELKGENINNYNTRATNNAHFIQLLRGAKISPFLRTLSSKDNNEDNNNLLSFIMQGNNDLATPTTTTTPKMNYSYNGASNYGSLIPSAVYARYAINKKTVMDNQLLSDEHKIQQQIQELEEIIFQLKQENDQQRQMNIIKQKEVSKLQIEQKEQRTKSKLLIQQAEQLLIEKEELVDHMDEIRHILKEEMEIRQKSQIRQNELEVMTEEVLNMNQILKHEIEDKEDKLNMKDLKCRVCFQENIEFALVPCYHCSYCRTCAEKLTECAICREAKYAIQKVYL
ncbi:hypothetical protein BDC45DRAFT_516182, partial [Circinella umbellata]